jgi:hypothetical protein
MTSYSGTGLRRDGDAATLNVLFFASYNQARRIKKQIVD